MDRAWGRRGIGRRWFVVLAALALFVRVLVPPGYMVSAAADAPGLVICTGHGPLVLSDHEQPGKAPKQSADAPCAFAAHGSVAPPPLALSFAALAFEPVERPLPARFDLAPGRGLAAPPPPSQGPPSVLI